MKEEKKEKKTIYPFGNFDRYYGYRSASYRNNQANNDIWNDPRLFLFKKQHFKRKTVLDIGCNSGFMTISIAEKFHPRMITGIDLDGMLITKARKLVSTRANELQKQSTQSNKQIEVEVESDDSFADPEETPSNTNLLSFQDYHFKEPFIYEDPLHPPEYSDVFFRTFPYNIYFKQEDFIEDLHYGRNYDTITCLSVTKWVHLNWGDDGLLYLLLKCYSLLKKYGMLILEYQTFPSYHKKSKYSERIRKHYETIKIHPEQIPTILQRLGMQLISSKTPNKVSTLSRTVTKGFNRPIIMLKKVGEELDIDFSKVKVEDIRKVFDVDKLLE